MFEFKYAITEKDYIDYNIFTYFNSPLNKRRIYFRKCSMLIIFAFLALFHLYISDFRFFISAPYIAFLTIAAVLYLLFFKKIAVFNITRNIKRMKKIDKDINGGGINTYKFRDNEFELLSDTAESKLEYKIIKNIVVTQNAVYLYSNSLQALILPSRIFENPENQNQFLGFLREKTN